MKLYKSFISNKRMSHSSTAFLKAVIYLLGIGAIALCIVAFPLVMGTVQAGNYRPLLLGMYATAIPFFIVLYKAMLLLKNIDTNQAFSKSSIISLQHIKYTTLIVALIYAIDVPFIYIIDRKDGLIGRTILGLVLTFAPFVVGVFAAVLEMLLRNGMEIKSENDLTI